MQVTSIDESVADEALRVVHVAVTLGELDPSDVVVQLWVVLDGSPLIVATRLLSHTGVEALYQATLEGYAPELIDEVVARVLPSPRHSDGEPLPGLITWSQ